MQDGFTAWKQKREYSGVATYTNGSYYHGLIPASAWGDPVNAKLGYVIYKIPLNGNGIFTNLKNLNLVMDFYLADKEGTDLKILTSFDGVDYTDFYNGKEKARLGEDQSVNLDMTELVNLERAKTSQYLYVKVGLEHSEDSVSLAGLGVKLYKISFRGKQNFVMDKGASVRTTGENGMRFTTLVDKELYSSLIAQGYTFTFGSFIMPKDYINEYGDLTYENLFGKNAKYCWGSVVEGKMQILHSNANLLENLETDYHGFRHSIVRILQDNINREFIARGYIKCEKDGQTQYIMAEYSSMEVENTARSMAYIAQRAIEGAVDNAYKTKLTNLYLNGLKGQTANYTVIHIYVSASNNINVVKSVQSAQIGSVVSANAELTYGQKTYSAVDSVVLAEEKLSSAVSGTVYADGRLVLVRVYKAQ